MVRPAPSKTHQSEVSCNTLSRLQGAAGSEVGRKTGPVAVSCLVYARRPCRAALHAPWRTCCDCGLQYDCSTEGPWSSRALCHHPRFTCKSAYFVSGAEGIRTPDLRRAKAARYFAGLFRRLQNCCKCKYLAYYAFPKLSGDLLGLLHGCCTKLESRTFAVAAPSGRRGDSNRCQALVYG